MIGKAYQLMLENHGFLNWWPGDGPLEISIGAILTQNTAWSNVEKALANLRRIAHLEDARAISLLPIEELQQALRPSGYYRLKSQRVLDFLSIIISRFDNSVIHMLKGETPEVRDRLLQIRGIGPETADSILLYAGSHPVMVVDAYTRRIFSRHGWCHSDEAYHALQEICLNAISADPSVRKHPRLRFLEDLHAQIVMVGKNYCRPRKPDCENCPLRCFLPDSGPILNPLNP